MFVNCRKYIKWRRWGDTRSKNPHRSIAVSWSADPRFVSAASRRSCVYAATSDSDFCIWWSWYV